MKILKNFPAGWQWRCMFHPSIGAEIVLRTTTRSFVEWEAMHILLYKRTTAISKFKLEQLLSSLLSSSLSQLSFLEESQLLSGQRKSQTRQPITHILFKKKKAGRQVM